MINMRNIKNIKFRYWNKHEKKMYESLTSEFIDNLKEMLTNNELSNYLNENIVMLQYTGLKDKNGKEIYEGDILSDLEVLDVNEEGKAELDYKIVVYDEDRCFFGLLDFGDPCPVMFDEYYIDELEVVGNIYEDKDKFELDGFTGSMFL